jgi:hypothetical protein
MEKLTMTVMTLEEFREKFDEVQAMGFVPSYRGGDTGVGYTLEKLIGVEENNLTTPDLGKIELKGHRTNSNSMITLFTSDRGAWKIKPKAAINKYGTFDDINQRMGLYFTMGFKPTRTGLILRVNDTAISVLHESGEIIGDWVFEILAKRFAEKFGERWILVSAESKFVDNKEYFKYKAARVLGGAKPEMLAKYFADGDMQLDLRLHLKPTGSVRNHGTGIRMRESKLPNVFDSISEL